MAVDSQKIAKNTLFMYLRLILTIPLSFITSRIVLQQLGVVDFGIYNVVGGIISFFAILRSSFAAATQRFYNVAIASDDNAALSRIYTTSLVVHVIIALALVLAIEIFGIWFIHHKMNYPVERTADVYFCFHLAVAALVFTIITIPFDAMVIAKERISFYAYLSILDIVLKLLLVCALIFITGDKLRIYAITQFIVPILLLLITFAYFKKNFPEVRLARFDAKSFREMSVFTGWGLLGNIGYSLSNQGTNLLLNVFGGVIVNTAQGISMQVRTIITKILGDTIVSVRPQGIQLFAKNERQEFFNLIYTYTKVLFALAVILCLPLIIYARQVLHFWLGSVPEYSTGFVILILLFCIVRSVHGPLDLVYHASGRMKPYQICALLAAVATFSLSWVALKLGFGVYSVYVIFMITDFLLSMSMVLMARRDGLAFGTFLHKAILPSLIFFCVCAVFSYGLYLMQLNFIVGIGISVCFNLTVAFYGLLSKSQRTTIISKVKNKLHHAG